MPRNGSGTYALPVAPFVPNTTILSADVNDDLSDIGDALTGSVAADGQTSMTGALLAFAGTLALPGVSWAVDTNTGRYRSGADAMADVAGGAAVAEYSSTGVNFPLAVTQAGVAIIPPGAIMPYAGTAAPTGWLICGGGSFLRADYPALFAVIGTTFGAADGTHFSMPDLRGRFPAGLDNMGAVVAGRITNITVTPNGQTLGATGGGQVVTIPQNTLPNVLLDTQLNNGAVAITDTRSYAGTKASSNVGVTGASDSILQASGSNNTLGITVTPSGGAISGLVSNLTGFTSSLSGGGSQQDLNKLPPTLMLNYIIRT